MKTLFVMTGAGISAESGVRTYRSDTGLWDEHAIEDVATPGGFQRDPFGVQKFYDARHKEIAAAEPNAAHLALARLAQDPRFTVHLVTQNIDDLHERAGSPSVIHIHGDIAKAHCAKCGRPSDAVGRLAQVVRCDCGHCLRPDVVWFGEQVKHGAEIEAAFLSADIFVSIGTSGQVWPAAAFARRARNRRLMTVEINPEITEISHFFRRRIRAPASEGVVALVEELLGEEPEATPVV